MEEMESYLTPKDIMEHLQLGKDKVSIKIRICFNDSATP